LDLTLFSRHLSIFEKVGLEYCIKLSEGSFKG